MPAGGAQGPGPEPGDRFAGIDATRAVAALAVLASHVIQTLTWRIPGWDSTAGRAAPVVHALTGTTGAWGVGLFLVVSGLCIHLPMARRLGGDPGARLDVRGFYRRRFVRIYPPYLAAMVLSAAVAWAMPAALSRSALVQVPTLAQVASHLLLVHTAVPGHDSAISAVFWTIALEAHFYALYPLLLAFRRRVSMAGLCASLLAVAIGARLVALAFLPARDWLLVDESILRRGWEFCLGMWVAERLVHEPRSRPGARLAWASLALVTLAGGIAVALVPGGLRVRAFLWPVLFAAAVEAAARSQAGSAASRRPLRWLGERSYSLYLVHPVGLALAIVILPGWAAARGAGCAAMLFCTAAVFLAFYRLVERPFAVRRATVPACPSPSS
jgi:peptidoglycan/LPS O-acetylase OafA/YrhL